MRLAFSGKGATCEETVMLWFGKAADVRTKSEVFQHIIQRNETLWKSVSGSPPDAELAELFQAAKSAAQSDWVLVNEIEQKLSRLLTENALHMEFLNLLELAGQRGLAKLAFHQGQRELLFSVMPTGQADAHQLDLKRRAYLALLQDVQVSYIAGRYTRRLRERTAFDLSRAGLWLVALAALPFVLYFAALYLGGNGAGALANSNPVYGIFSVLTFGLLGAFFSRLQRFQSSASTLGVDEKKLYFDPGVMGVRLIIGMVGAMAFYLFMRSGIVSGDVFPDFARLAIQPADAVITLADGSEKTLVSSYLQPTKDLAKLIVWSFLAGFSERLVPDAIAKSEARAGEGAAVTG
jgi:hypothetical protein